MRDWASIEALYVAGDMSQKELADSMGISYSTLSKVATANKWRDKRQKHRKKTANAVLGRARARNEKKLEKLIKASERAMDTALAALEDEKQFRRWIVTEGQGEGVSSVQERMFDKIDTKSLKELTGVLRDLTALTRDFYGIRTPAQSVAEKIATERLELEKKKVEAGLREDAPQEIRVVLEKEMEALSE